MASSRTSGYFFVTGARAAEIPAEQQMWITEFVNWARSLSPVLFRNGPDEVDGAYERHLAASGLAAEAIETRCDSIRKHRGASRQWLVLTTDNLYANGWYASMSPSSFLRDFLAGKTPGKALDCGAGAGRNSALLADLGWNVTSLDLSQTGLERAASLALDRGHPIETVCCSYSEFAWGVERWDLVVNVDAYHPTLAAAPIAECLVPGGFLYVEQHLAANTRPDPFLIERLSAVQILGNEVRTDPAAKGFSKDVAIIVAQKAPLGPPIVPRNL